ncbi:MAG: type II and III secretion system protein family protein [Parvibaculaceae bacterium]|nr:type II and III secretion system protein family protein [Parvibaculaceae bacterium]
MMKMNVRTRIHEKLKSVSLKKALTLLCVALLAAVAGPGADRSVWAAGDAQLVRIAEGGDSTASRSLVLGLSKAAIIELPVEARDVLVSNPAIVDAVVRTTRRTYLIGMEVGQTNAFFFNERGEQILNLEIRVERDLSSLDEMLSRFLPNARIKVEAVNNNIVLSGRVPNASQSAQARDLAARFIGDEKNVLNMLAIEGKEQVMLRVTVAEMQRTLIKQLGVDLTSRVDFGSLVLSLATENALSLQGGSLGGLTSSPSGAPATGGSDLNGALRALERAGLLRTLAEPNLTAISGESASFLAGGEFPVPKSQDRNGNIILEFKPFGVGLGFSPVVLGEGRISLKISTEVSELSNEGSFVFQGTSVTDANGNIVSRDGVTVPALRVRRAETTVELPSGGSMVMAGLLSESTKQNIDGVPGIKDVPVLGSLFRSRDFQDNETELVVIVTPYLVDATSRDKIVLPTDGYAPASDLDTFLMGRLNATYGVAGARQVEGSLQGPVGFVVD